MKNDPSKLQNSTTTTTTACTEAFTGAYCVLFSSITS